MYLYILSLLQPSQLDHLFGQIDDLNTLAHIEDKNISPFPMLDAIIISEVASSKVKKYRSIAESVTVTGPPKLRSVSTKYETLSHVSPAHCQISIPEISYSRLHLIDIQRSFLPVVWWHPLTLAGFTALSDEINTILSTQCNSDNVTTFQVP